ncbi:hypothetical protein LAZ67_3005837 [Cordylochernes scorpioides]|uniref:Transposase n=1 Tax=Cordylochernes scorpioides TaxID=51811 RepID=A0ABY6KDS0_9ARAC|nr:hypothetical protein LAZ67_3005837 [Cordylochernes scorpioides]
MMQTRKEICLDFIESYPGPASEAFKGVIMCDETWSRKKPRLSLSKDKIKITAFWDQDGLIFMDMLEKILPSTRKDIIHFNKKDGPQDWQIKFHENNVRPHTAQQTLALISRYGWTLTPHPAYSPDLAPFDFYLFAINTIINDHLKYRKLVSRWVLHRLTEDQKLGRVKCRNFIDETWIYNFDPETKQQSTLWCSSKSPPPKKVRRAQSVGKQMVIYFFRKSGFIDIVKLED